MFSYKTLKLQKKYFEILFSGNHCTNEKILVLYYQKYHKSIFTAFEFPGIDTKS